MTTMRLKTGRWQRVTGCAVILLMLQGCAGVSQGDFCRLYKPVYTGESDSEQTRAENDGNNAVWLELCPGGD